MNSTIDCQCILKVVGHPGKYEVKQRMLEMIRNPDVCFVGDEWGFQVSTEERVTEIYEEWARDFEKIKPNMVRKARHAEHLCLSAKIGASKPEELKLLISVMNFLTENFDGHNCLYSINPHAKPYPVVMLLIQSYNNMTDKKLHMPHGWTTKMRYAWSEALNKNGIGAEA